MSAWKPFRPSAAQPWDRRRVIHLHRRAVFGGTRAEVERDTEDSPEDAVNRVLHGECRMLGIPDEFHSLSDLIGNAAADSPDANRLKAWWIYRCLFSPDPLQERLTFMWHNHFATSNVKVDSLRHMKRQNELLRKHSRAEFSELLGAIVRDPALLIWLDAPSNRKGRANENLARELMELFTLGIGPYSESDIKEAARALTGVTLREGEYQFDQRTYDDGEKRVLGHTGNFVVESLVDLLLDHPATAERLAWRLVTEFFGDGVVDREAQAELAALLRKSDLNVGVAVEVVLHSQLFFSDENINTRISDPLSFLITPIRVFELFEEPPSTLLLPEWLRRMGLDLFYPPNVGGWQGARSWLNTRTIIGRANYIAAVMAGEIYQPQRELELAGKFGCRSVRSCVETVGELLRGELRSRDIDDALPQNGQPPSDKELDPETAIANLMTQARAHLH